MWDSDSWGCIREHASSQQQLEDFCKVAWLWLVVSMACLERYIGQFLPSLRGRGIHPQDSCNWDKGVRTLCSRRWMGCIWPAKQTLIGTSSRDRRDCTYGYFEQMDKPDQESWVGVGLQPTQDSSATESDLCCCTNLWALYSVRRWYLWRSPVAVQLNVLMKARGVGIGCPFLSLKCSSKDGARFSSSWLQTFGLLDNLWSLEDSASGLLRTLGTASGTLGTTL